MKNFSKDLKKHTTEIIHHEKKMMRLKNEENKIYVKQKDFYIYKKEFSTNDENDHNGSKYDYHFIIKELPKEFELQFVCL